MFSKDKLLSIRELDVSGKIENMTDMQFDIYAKQLNSFIDGIPSMTERLKDFMKTKTYNAAALLLKNNGNTLAKLHARGLADQCSKQVAILDKADKDTSDHDELEMGVENVIQAISALSIDLQMTEYKSAQPRAAKPKAGQAAAARPAKTRGRNPLILAVDNAVMFLMNLEMMLEKEPYELKCVSTCNEALDFLDSNSPDMILLDVDMPDMNGYDLAKRIVSSGEKAPILFITANSKREYVQKAAEAGAVGLLMKPLRINQLMAKLKEFI